MPSVGGGHFFVTQKSGPSRILSGLSPFFVSLFSFHDNLLLFIKLVIKKFTFVK